MDCVPKEYRSSNGQNNLPCVCYSLVVFLSTYLKMNLSGMQPVIKHNLMNNWF